MNASCGPVGTSSPSHKARAPGTEMALGRSSTISGCGFCSSCVCGLVGVVLGRDPLLFGKPLWFISYLHLALLCSPALVGSTVEFSRRSFVKPLQTRLLQPSSEPRW